MKMDNNESDGYKDTPIGRIPGDWKVESLISAVGNKNYLIVGGPFGSCLMVKDYQNQGIPIIRLQNVDYGKFIDKDIKYISPVKAEELKYHSFVSGDIILAKLGDPIGKTCIIPPFLKSGIVVADVVRIRSENSDSDKVFLMNVLNSPIVSMQLNRGTIGTTRQRVNVGQVRDLLLPLPPLQEQQKIAAILSTVDAAIAETDALIAKTERIKKGLMQELFTKGIGHTEFKDTKIGRVPEEWDICKIDENFNEVIETSSNKEKYPIYSLTIENGLIPKTDRYERSFLMKNGDENEFKKVSYADIVYNPMNLRFGAITISKIEFPITVSIYYNVIRRNGENVDPWYYSELFQTDKYHYIFESVASGSLLEKKRVHWSVFREIKIPHPPLEEQQKISNILKCYNDRLEREQQYRTYLGTLKHGLMQDLLTGRVRVKTDTGVATHA